MNKNCDSKILKIAGIAGTMIFIAALFVAVYMMSRNMGQAPGIDFGPGQYYYTDIPGWQKYFLVNAYDNHVPMAALIGLFFAWGYLMFRAWCFLDKHLGEE